MKYTVFDWLIGGQINEYAGGNNESLVFHSYARRFIAVLRGTPGEDNRDAYRHTRTCVFLTSNSSQHGLILSDFAEIFRGPFLQPKENIKRGTKKCKHVTNKWHPNIHPQFPLFPPKNEENSRVRRFEPVNLKKKTQKNSKWNPESVTGLFFVRVVGLSKAKKLAKSKHASLFLSAVFHTLDHLNL